MKGNANDDEGSRVRHSCSDAGKPRFEGWQGKRDGRDGHLKTKDGNHTQLWCIAAFSEPVQVELRRLTAGDAVAIEGALKAELYDRDGETELSFGVNCRARPAAAPAGPHAKEGRPSCYPRGRRHLATKVPSMRVPF